MRSFGHLINVQFMPSSGILISELWGRARGLNKSLPGPKRAATVFCRDAQHAGYRERRPPGGRAKRPLDRTGIHLQLMRKGESRCTEQHAQMQSGTKELDPNWKHSSLCLQIIIHLGSKIRHMISEVGEVRQWETKPLAKELRLSAAGRTPVWSCKQESIHWIFIYKYYWLQGGGWTDAEEMLRQNLRSLVHSTQVRNSQVGNSQAWSRYI